MIVIDTSFCVMKCSAISLKLSNLSDMFLLIVSCGVIVGTVGVTTTGFVTTGVSIGFSTGTVGVMVGVFCSCVGVDVDDVGVEEDCVVLFVFVHVFATIPIFTSGVSVVSGVVVLLL